jgi:hypothetical protein
VLKLDHSFSIEFDYGMQLEMDIGRTAGGKERKPKEATVRRGLSAGGQSMPLTEALEGEGILLAEAAGGRAKTLG